MKDACVKHSPVSLESLEGELKWRTGQLSTIPMPVEQKKIRELEMGI